ncbi:hypothetical protein GCM10023165_18320 [Variovorax defluvii]|uniref:Uncharacterized protein n=1 Tax=Variovorax defluvii TaxID=913761 RepID=A0ABP8HGY6_9BURK
MTEVPERLYVAGKADPLRDALGRVATVLLQEFEHGTADLRELTIRRAAQPEDGRRQESEETAE